MNRTKIEYLDYTWNPVVGCNGVGCAVRKHCWARSQAKRQKPLVDRNGNSRGCLNCYDFRPHYHFERFNEPLKVKKPARIGVSFMGDLFDSAFSITFHQQLFEIMARASWHTFVVLTKQSQNMRTFVENWAWSDVPINVWLGVSVNRKEDLHRIDDLKVTSAVVKFVSFEPLYEDLGDVDLSGIDWVIIGAQRRPNMQPTFNAVKSVISQAQTDGAKVFLKNNLDLNGLNKWRDWGQRELPFLQELPEVRSK
jgi:protein gp37